MDLSSFGKVHDTAVVEVYHPVTGEVLRDDSGQPMWLEVYGQDSAHAKAVEHEITNRNISRQMRARGSTPLKAEALDTQALEKAARCVRAWHLQLSGDTPECEPNTAQRVFSEYPWLREQAEQAMQDRKHFLTESSPS